MRGREEELRQPRMVEVVRPVALRLRHCLQQTMQQQSQPRLRVLRGGEVVALVADESDGSLRQRHRGGGEEAKPARQPLVGHRDVHACRQKGRPRSGEETAKTNSRSRAPGGSGTSSLRHPVPSRTVRGTWSDPKGSPSAKTCTAISGRSASYARSPMTPPRTCNVVPALPRAANRPPTGKRTQRRGA